MNVWRSVLFFHVLAGMIGFFAAPAAMLTAKGGLWHRRWGKVYFWAMTVAAFSAMALSIFGPRTNLFLTLIGVFSFYLSYSGYRVLYQKRPAKGQGPHSFDWLMATVTALTGLGLMAAGIFKPTPLWERTGVVAVALGAACLVTAGVDIKRFLRPPADRNFWWYSHMAGMLGSYIAALTAFLVNNARHVDIGAPAWVWWLAPTIVGAPAISVWTAYYRKKFTARLKVTPVGTSQPTY